MNCKKYLPVLLSLPVFFALGSGSANAQAVGPSDVLFEVITGNGLPISSPHSFTIPEGMEAPMTFTIPALTVDFLEAGGNGTTHISDRFHFNQYTVTVTSDTEAGLTPRSGAHRINEAQANLLMRIVATSFGEGDTQVSDTLRFVLGEDVDSTTPIPEGAEGALEGEGFTVLARRYDLIEADGTVSDYVDISNVNGFFLSSDNPADYLDPDVNFTPNAFIQEPYMGSAALDYRLNFSSDQDMPVPEPGTYAMLGGLLVSGLGILRRRRAA